ncbi:MAG: hypothetical protein J2P18_08715 [Nocardia sp.]|nr:hypothetical protein [Nocardia sp.]
MSEQDLAHLIDQFGPRGQEVAVTTAERIQARGRVEGRAEALLTQLAAKFGRLPAGIVDRVHNATPEQLNDWTVQILSATTLDELFE